MIFWSNLIGYQVVWFTVVIGAGHGDMWPGVGAAVCFVTWQWLVSRWRAVDARLLAVAIGLGVLVDGVLAQSGWVRYATPHPALPLRGAPLWILALWASFSLTINRSLAYLRDRGALALVCGAVGAPLAYWGAQRGWQAVVFQPPAWRALIWLSATWAMAMLTLGQLAKRWIRTATLDTSRVRARL